MTHCAFSCFTAVVQRARGLVVIFFLTALLSPLEAQEPAAGISEFDAQAFAALPIEKSYAFARALAESQWQLRRDPQARPDAGELAIPANGWVVLIKSQASAPLRQAAEDLRAYLEAGMQTRVEVETAPSLAEVAKRRRAIVVGTRADLPGCGDSLTGSKDYAIRVSGEQVMVCGYDELGAMYGLYNLEERMDLREAPFLPRHLDTSRHSLYKARMTLSGLGWMEWPDKYLAWLPRYGFDSIFESAYANVNGQMIEPYFPNLPMRKQDPARVHDLVRRAARYGIRLYCPILYHYTGTPENEQGLRRLVREIVTEFPEIRGYIVLTEGFYYKTWFGAGGHGKLDLQEWSRGWAKGVGIVAEECHKINPAIEVLPWDYNVDFRKEYVDLNRYSAEQLPQDTIPLVTFENGKDFTLDGEHGYIRDYSISQVGPSETTAARIAVAKERRMPGVYSKADTWASWQFGTSPHLPFPYQWYERYRALEQQGIDGTMESWTYGFKPNFVAEMRNWYSWSDAPPLEALLREIARRDFGAGSEALVLEAWKRFSAAIRLDPDNGPTEGGNNAVANPLFFEQPEEFHILTLNHSFLDEQEWMKHSYLNPYWPYVIGTYVGSNVFYPDFTNRVNEAEQYAQPFSLGVFEKYLRRAADEMEKGLESYRQAALRAPAAKRQNALREVLLAEQIERMMRSNEAIVEFEDLRFRWAKSGDPSERGRLLDHMTEILKEEIPRTQASLETARRDSRLGYEWEQDYMYWPEVFRKKIELLELTLHEKIPAYRH
jgi:hypothetical protein